LDKKLLKKKLLSDCDQELLGEFDFVLCLKASNDFDQIDNFKFFLNFI